MPLARTEWEAGLSADAVLRDQCLSVGLQALFLKTREGKKMGKGFRGETRMRGNL